MKEEIIQDIVEKVFAKAEKEQPSISRFARAKHIADCTLISSKTAERYYGKYVDKEEKNIHPSTYTVNQFCDYLGYKNYQDYIAKNEAFPVEKPVADSKKKVHNNAKKLMIFGGIAILIALFMYVGFSWEQHEKSLPASTKCMTWAEDHYQKISCNTQPYSQFGTHVIPLNKEKLQNFKKVEVSPATRFFSEATGNPLIWYYKTDEDELEFYTAPGLHPINGETLRKITEYMIEKYVPVHEYREGSFID